MSAFKYDFKPFIDALIQELPENSARLREYLSTINPLYNVQDLFTIKYVIYGVFLAGVISFDELTRLDMQIEREIEMYILWKRNKTKL